MNSSYYIDILLTNLVSIVPGLALGALISYWHLQKQHKDQLALQIAHSRDEILVNIYESLSESIQSCQCKITEINATVSSCPGRIQGYWLQKLELGIQDPTHISDRCNSLTQLNFDLQRTIASVMSTIERYNIIFASPRLFDAFKMALTMQSRKQATTFNSFLSAVRAHLPVDVSDEFRSEPEKTAVEGRQLQEDQLGIVTRLSEIHSKECIDLLGCLIDLLNEAQNSLLGHLFQRTVQPRIPHDSTRISVRNEDASLSDIEKRFKDWEGQFHQPPLTEGSDISP